MSSAALAQVRPGPDPGDLAGAFKAPLLERILHGDALEANDEEPLPKRAVLDFSMPSQSLLDRLRSSGPCSVQIVDLYRTGGLTALNAAGAFEDPECQPAVDHILPPPGREMLDLVLCWDLPNYLSLAALNFLCTQLAGRVKPGCRLHMLITYAKREMPSLPPHYSLLPDGRLRPIRENDSLGPAPRYSPEDLSLALAPFRYERGVLLANGMQEFVYTWQG